MENYLWADILFASPAPKQYWWPIVFHTIQHAGFSFLKEENDEKGEFFPSKEDVYGPITGDFKAMWDWIYTENVPVLVFFEHKELKFTIEVSLREENALVSKIEITVTEGRIVKQDEEVLLKRLKAFFYVCVTVYKIVEAREFKVFWEELEPDTNLVLVTSQKNISEVVIWCDHVLQWKYYADVGEQKIYIVDPFPLTVRSRSRRSWRYVHLVE